MWNKNVSKKDRASSVKDYSKEHSEYLKKVRQRKRTIIFIQLLILVVFFVLWEVAARLKIIDPFLVSQQLGSQPCRSVSQGVGRMFCLPKTAWPPT